MLLALGWGCGRDDGGPAVRGSTQIFNDGGTLYALGETDPYTGPVIDFHPNGKKSYAYRVENGRPQGTVTEWYASGQKKTESTLKDGVLVGKMVGWHENGKKEYEMPLEDGEIHGTGNEYYGRGPIRSLTPYVKGKREGREVGYTEAGIKLWEAAWKADRLEGEYVEFYASSQRKSLTPYMAGKIKGKSIGWFEDGGKAWESNWDGEKPVGSHLEWYPNKELKSQKTYSGGLLVTIADWHRNGKKSREISFANGRPTSQKQWDENGTLVVATGTAALPPVAGKPGPTTGELPKPNPNAAGRRMVWLPSQLAALYKGKTAVVVEAAFGVPDMKAGNTWVYNKITLLDPNNRRRLATVNFVMQDGMVVLVRFN